MWQIEIWSNTGQRLEHCHPYTYIQGISKFCQLHFLNTTKNHHRHFIFIHNCNRFGSGFYPSFTDVCICFLTSISISLICLLLVNNNWSTLPHSFFNLEPNRLMGHFQSHRRGKGKRNQDILIQTKITVAYISSTKEHYRHVTKCDVSVTKMHTLPRGKEA